MIGALNMFADATSSQCQGGHLLSFPTWYEYLQRTYDTVTTSCVVQINGINDVWLIVAAVIEIMLRVGGLLAVVFVIYGGFQYLTSQAEPETVTRARKTIVNALIGLAISVTASVLVNFIAGSIGNA